MSTSKKPAAVGLNGALAATIRGELAARGQTRIDLANRSGIPLDTLKNYLASNPDRARVMDIQVIDAIAGALGLGASQLVAMAEVRRARDAVGTTS